MLRAIKMHQRSRGVALILALFTTAILVTLSLAFITLAVGESRTSKSAGYESASIDAANFGLMLGINYMGRGKAPLPTNPPSNVTVWQNCPWPDNLGFYNVLARQSSAILHQGYYIQVQTPADDPTLTSYANSSMVSNPAFLSQVQQNVRRMQVINPLTNSTALIPLGTDLAFSVDVVAVPILPSSRVPSLQLVATSRVYNAAGATSSSLTGAPVATRVIQARVLPEAASSYLQFLSNGQTFAAQGVGYDAAFNTSFNNTQPPSQQQAAFASMTNTITAYAQIPGNYTGTGTIRIDGDDPSLANVVGNTTLQYWNSAQVNASGNLFFAPDAVTKTQGGNVTFQDLVSINKLSNSYASGLSDANSGFFQGGFRAGVSRFGLPTVSMTEFQEAATDVTGTNMTAASFQVQTSQIPGATGSDVTAPRSTPDPIYASFTTQVVNGQSVQTGVPFDYRPQVPRTDITLSNGTVIVQTTAVGTNTPIGAPQSIPVSQINNGIIYVDGGNTGVKSDPNAPFNGQLTIVAVDSSQRTSGAPGASIYSDAASAFFAEESARWNTALAQGTSTPALAATIQTPPYSVAQLQAAYNGGDITVAPPAIGSGATAATSFTWPSPAPDVAREGNLVVEDDVKYGSQRTNSLGLIAQNFILINDATPGTPGQGNNSIEVDAVLLSQNKSVQFDWDNTARLPNNTWQIQAQATNATSNTTGYNGVMNLKGSIVGEFVDIEGDELGRGYPQQNMIHDPNLAYQRPPLFPSWDFSVLPGGFQFAITQYKDLGVLTTD